VTGYGLAAAQLDRLIKKGLHLTVCVDEVAASGGYLMACVGQRICASPFAVLGSVGVVTTMPNVAERLKREGVEVADITAGKYKRTMTPFKVPTEEDTAKVKQDLEDVLTIFKSYITAHRPSLAVDEIATGEVWFGQDALDRGLVDVIRTSDDVILDFIHQGADVMTVKYTHLPTSYLGNLLDDNMSASSALTLDTLLRVVMGLFVKDTAALLQEHTQDPVKGYMLTSSSTDFPPTMT
jgi:serine protease SohB